MKDKARVLLTNDDGFYAEGLQILYSTLVKIAQVTIVAPDRERSAVGHGITMHQPLRTTPVRINNNDHWVIDGTPSDCIKLAIEYLLKDNSPDIIISGINRGPNLGNDVLYSGTVSAAMEGTINNKRSIATSIVGYGQIDFLPAANFICENLNTLIELAQETTLNINFPAKTAFEGVKFTRLGKRIYQNVFEERKDPRGQTYFWMGGKPISYIQSDDSDITAVEKGFISLTPLKFDITDFHFLNKHDSFPR